MDNGQVHQYSSHPPSAFQNSANVAGTIPLPPAPPPPPHQQLMQSSQSFQPILGNMSSNHGSQHHTPIPPPHQSLGSQVMHPVQSQHQQPTPMHMLVPNARSFPVWTKITFQNDQVHHNGAAIPTYSMNRLTPTEGLGTYLSSKLTTSLHLASSGQKLGTATFPDHMLESNHVEIDFLHPNGQTYSTHLKQKGTLSTKYEFVYPLDQRCFYWTKDPPSSQEKSDLKYDKSLNVSSDATRFLVDSGTERIVASFSPLPSSGSGLLGASIAKLSGAKDKAKFTSGQVFLSRAEGAQDQGLEVCILLSCFGILARKKRDKNDESALKILEHVLVG